MELSWTSNLTTPVPTEFFVSSISTPADLKAELTNEEYVTFCEAARTKGGFAGKWFELTPDEAASLAAPPCATPPPLPLTDRSAAVSDAAPPAAARDVPPTPKPLPPSAPPAPTQAQAASEAALSVDGVRRTPQPLTLTRTRQPTPNPNPSPNSNLNPNPYPHRCDVAAAASKAPPQEAGLDA